MDKRTQAEINSSELNIIGALVEDYCTTSETTTSMAVERIILELDQSKATVKLLQHKLKAHETSPEEQ